ncbi:hypothetical protein MUK42_29166 [Musa troglodytarum]|uniref:Uncharacterized protein n=1 Tax=Musa troglodytarum TaxID=320322 RepID=A0A9E7FPU6_9LILI|nr:hypothetical protein MUK42_29166 [Musa troglodytarum]
MELSSAFAVMNSGSSTRTVHQAYIVRFECCSLLINRKRKLLRSVASLTQPLRMQVFHKNSTSPYTITKPERARLLLLYLTSVFMMPYTSESKLWIHVFVSKGWASR